MSTLANHKDKHRVTIMLAEDSRTDANYLSKIVRNMGYEIIVAEDGLQALECYFSENIDIVILDIDLPHMSGIEVAENIYSDARSTPIIFTTSTIDEEMLAHCYKLGADDFLLKPYNTGLVEIKLRSYLNILRMRTMLEGQRDLIAKNNRALISEQKSARRIFDTFSFSSDQDNPNIRFNLSALSIFNGDVILSATGPSGNLFVFLGDFTGHGLVASLSSMPLIQTFHRMVEKGFSMAVILQEINSRLNSTLPVDIFCCGIMLMLDPRTEELEVWNGGLPDCYLYSNEKSSYDVITSKHLPLGVLKSDKFRLKIDLLQMKRGDHLLMCSDGILEARNAGREMYGSERMIKVLDNVTSEDNLFEKIQDSVSDFTDGAIRDDDVSLVEVTMPEPAVLLTKVKAEGCRDRLENSHITGSLDYLIEPEMMRHGNPVTALMQMLLDVPGLKKISSELYTVTTELYANALDHGILGLDSSIKSSAEGFDTFYRSRKEMLENLDSGHIRFIFNYKCDDAQGEIMVRIEDSGPGFDISSWRKARANKNMYSGRGLGLIEQIASSSEIIEPGNILEIVMHW